LHWAALAFSSLAIGTVFPDYVITFVRNPLLDLALSGLVAAATIVLIYVAHAVPLPDLTLMQLSPPLAAKPAA
jgi:hypothetical protein